MKEEKKSFVLYHSFANQFELLSMEERGELISAIFQYERTREANPLTPLVQMAFSCIREALDRDRAAYEEKCEQNAKNGKKGGRPRKVFFSEKTERFFEKPKKADNDNDNGNDNENDNENENGNGNGNGIEKGYIGANAPRSAPPPGPPKRIGRKSKPVRKKERRTFRTVPPDRTASRKLTPILRRVRASVLPPRFCGNRARRRGRSRRRRDRRARFRSLPARLPARRTRGASVPGALFPF